MISLRDDFCTSIPLGIPEGVSCLTPLTTSTVIWRDCFVLPSSVSFVKYGIIVCMEFWLSGSKHSKQLGGLQTSRTDFRFALIQVLSWICASSWIYTIIFNTASVQWIQDIALVVSVTERCIRLKWKIAQHKSSLFWPDSALCYTGENH